MRTYTHGVIGYLLYAKRPRHEQRLAIMGGILPDVFLALGFVPHYLEHVTQSPLVAEIHTLLHRGVDRKNSATRQCGSIGTGGCNAFMKLCVSSSRCESCPAKGEPARAGSQPCAGVRNGLGDA